MFEDQYVELLPARTTMKACKPKKKGGSYNYNTGGAGGAGGDGGNGGDRNVAIAVNVALFTNGDVTQTATASAGNGGAGGAGGAGGSAG